MPIGLWEKVRFSISKTRNVNSTEWKRAEKLNKNVTTSSQINSSLKNLPITEFTHILRIKRLTMNSWIYLTFIKILFTIAIYSLHWSKRLFFRLSNFKPVTILPQKYTILFLLAENTKILRKLLIAIIKTKLGYSNVRK